LSNVVAVWRLPTSVSDCLTSVSMVVGGNNCCSLRVVSEAFDRPKIRESSDPSILNSYTRFWEGSEWELFLVPDPTDQGFSVADSVKVASSRPGVYEFALARPDCTGSKVPVYVGESVNVQNRHRDYGKDGSSLQGLLKEYIARKHYLLFRRVKHVGSKNIAERWEARFLIAFDYAWNVKLNIARRDIELGTMDACCCKFGVSVTDTISRRRHYILSKPMLNFFWYAHLVASIVQIVCCVIIIVIVATKLDVVLSNLTVEAPLSSSQPACFLSENTSNDTYCNYAYAMGSISMAFSSLLGYLVIISHLGTKTSYMSWISLLLMCIWTLVWTLTSLDSINGANSAELPLKDWRTAIEVVSWILFSSYSFELVLQTLCSIVFCVV